MSKGQLKGKYHTGRKLKGYSVQIAELCRVPKSNAQQKMSKSTAYKINIETVPYQMVILFQLTEREQYHKNPTIVSKRIREKYRLILKMQNLS